MELRISKILENNNNIDISNLIDIDPNFKRSSLTRKLSMSKVDSDKNFKNGINTELDNYYDNNDNTNNNDINSNNNFAYSNGKILTKENIRFNTNVIDDNEIYEEGN